VLRNREMPMMNEPIDLKLPPRPTFKPDIFKELSNLKRFNIVCKSTEESKTGHYVSYDDVLKLFHKYLGG
jgi:hypothetical protein